MSAAAPVDVSTAALAIIRRILGTVLPQHAQVWVFGSRAKWTTRPGSDLDLAIDARSPLTRREATRLAVEFEESNIP